MGPAGHIAHVTLHLNEARLLLTKDANYFDPSRHNLPWIFYFPFSLARKPPFQGVQCRTMHCSNASDLADPANARLLLAHFRTHGTPVMIGCHIRLFHHLHTFLPPCILVQFYLAIICLAKPIIFMDFFNLFIPHSFQIHLPIPIFPVVKLAYLY